MSTYLLVHGAWHGGWCWHKVVVRLRAAGHRVLAPDLPGLGRDRTLLSEISLASWTAYLCRILDAELEPVVLVGHSRGGILISEAAERCPQKVQLLVYLAAFMLRNGECVFRKAQEDTSSLVAANMVRTADGNAWSIREEATREAFYGECSDADVVLAQSLLCPEPAAPLAAALTVSAERFASVPRVYVECRRDRAVSLDLQRRMQAALPCREILSLDSDHSPFLSDPDGLTAHLLSLGR